MDLPRTPDRFEFGTGRGLIGLRNEGRVTSDAAGHTAGLMAQLFQNAGEDVP